MLPAQPNQSLIDGLACLQALAGRGGAVGMRELARELNLEPTRVNRLLRTLAHLGLAEQDEQRKYRPGPAIHVLAAQSLFGSGLIRRALPHLEDLHCHGHLVAMGVRWQDKVAYLYHGHPGMRAAEALGRVELRPATLTGVGMMLMASQEDAAIRDLYKDRAPEGFDSIDQLLARLREVRAQGYVRMVLEPSPLLATLAVPVGAGRYAAIAFSGPITEDIAAKLLPHLVAAAVAIDPKSPVPPHLQEKS